MAHVPETGAINRLRKSGSDFCHANLLPDSGIDCNTALFQARTGMHATQMTTYDWSLVFPVTGKL